MGEISVTAASRGDPNPLPLWNERRRFCKGDGCNFLMKWCWCWRGILLPALPLLLPLHPSLLLFSGASLASDLHQMFHSSLLQHYKQKMRFGRGLSRVWHHQEDRLIPVICVFKPVSEFSPLWHYLVGVFSLFDNSPTQPWARAEL